MNYISQYVLSWGPNTSSYYGPALQYVNIPQGSCVADRTQTIDQQISDQTWTSVDYYVGGITITKPINEFMMTIYGTSVCSAAISTTKFVIKEPYSWLA